MPRSISSDRAMPTFSTVSTSAPASVTWLIPSRLFSTRCHCYPACLACYSSAPYLSFAVERAGNLYLAIGLHAGWVFSLKALRVFGDFQRERLGWLFGSSDPKIVSGVATWAAILLAGVAVYYLTKNRAVRLNDLPRAVTA